MGVSVFKIDSRRKGLGNVAMHGKGVRGGRERRAPFFIIRLQLGEGPIPKGSLIAKTPSAATGPRAVEDCISPKAELGVC